MTRESLPGPGADYPGARKPLSTPSSGEPTHRIPIANIYYLLCYAWRHVEEGDVVRIEELDELDAVRDLLAKVLAEGTFRLLKRGLDRGYREVRQDLAGVRGKIAIGDTAKRALRARSRVACVFEELSHDVLHNQVLRSTLRALLSVPDLDPTIRSEVRNAWSKLNGVAVVALSRQIFQRVQLDRNRRYYRFLLSICRLIHDQLLVDESTGETRFIDFTKDQMAKLYEDFAIGFYRREQSRYRVNASGRRIDWLDRGTPEEHLSLVPKMEADIILESEERRIILDTKFYGRALGGQFGSRKLHSANLYQLLAYLTNREKTAERGPRHEGILLYPTVDERLDAEVRLQGFRIRARTVDLAQDWRSVHDAMLAAIA